MNTAHLPNTPNIDLKDLYEFLTLRYKSKDLILNTMEPHEVVRDLYRQFHVFCGAETQVLWYGSFIDKLEQLTGDRWKQCLNYIRTVDFMYFVDTLEQQIK